MPGYHIYIIVYNCMTVKDVYIIQLVTKLLAGIVCILVHHMYTSMHTHTHTHAPTQPACMHAVLLIVIYSHTACQSTVHHT